MKNAEWMVEQKYKFIDLRAFDAYNTNISYEICLYTEDHTWKRIGELTKVYTDKSTAVLAWLDEEHKEPILDDAEKRYLSTIIRPFRADVQCIVKYSGHFSSRDYEYISVRYQEKVCEDTNLLKLPWFEKGTMYKGMETNRKYTIEELGL